MLRPAMDVIFPRSPLETMAGWVYLPRFVDKVRLHLAGKLSADYTANFAYKGFDAKWLVAAGVKAEDFIQVVAGTVTDGQVCDWVERNINPGRAHSRAAFNAHALNFGRGGDSELAARLKMRKEAAGVGSRDDVDTFFACIDADEKRI